MIQMQTMLEVADNSGAKRISCIHTRGRSINLYSQIGDVITVMQQQQDMDMWMPTMFTMGHFQRPNTAHHPEPIAELVPLLAVEESAIAQDQDGQQVGQVVGSLDVTL